MFFRTMLTHTIGYFNANPWSVSIYVRQTGASIILNKGQYLLDANGNKVNDPLFDSYRGILTKEEDKNEHPVVTFDVPHTQEISGSSGVNGTTDASQADAIIKQGTHSSSANKIKAYSADQAKLQGFITDINDFDKVFDNAPKDAGIGKINTDMPGDSSEVASPASLVEAADTASFEFKPAKKLEIREVANIPSPVVKPVDVPNVKLATIDDIKRMEDSLPTPTLNTDSTKYIWNGVEYRTRADMMLDVRRTHPEQLKEAGDKYPAKNRKKV